MGILFESVVGFEDIPFQQAQGGLTGSAAEGQPTFGRLHECMAVKRV
jgi:hypothetical protein